MITIALLPLPLMLAVTACAQISKSTTPSSVPSVVSVSAPAGTAATPSSSSPVAAGVAARPDICNALEPVHASKSKDSVETRIEVAHNNAVMAQFCGFKP